MCDYHTQSSALYFEKIVFPFELVINYIYVGVSRICPGRWHLSSFYNIYWVKIWKYFELILFCCFDTVDDVRVRYRGKVNICYTKYAHFIFADKQFLLRHQFLLGDTSNLCLCFLSNDLIWSCLNLCAQIC